MLAGLKPFIFLLPVMMAGYAALWACLTPAARREITFTPLLTFIVLGAAAFLSPNLWVLNAIFFLAPSLMARSREQVGLILLVGVLASPAFNVWLVVGGLQLTSETVQMTLGLGALIALVMHKGRSVRRSFSADLPMVLFTALTLFTLVRGTTVTNILRESITVLVQLVVPYIVFTRAMNTPGGVKRALLWLMAATAILSAIVMYESLTSWPLYAGLEDRFGVRSTVLTVKFRGGWMRAYGPFLEALTLGFILVFGFAATLISRSAFVSRTKHRALLGLMLIGLATPQSRSAWLGTAVVIFGVALYRAKGRPFGLVISGALTASILYIVSSWGKTNVDAASTADYRTRLAQQGMEEFWKRPLTGDTLPHILARMSDLVQGEGIVDFVNTYLFYALLGGVIGFLILVACFVIPIARLWKRRHRFPLQSPVRDAATYCFATLLASAVMISVTGFGGQPRLLTLLAMGLAGLLPLLKPSPGSTRLAGRERLQPAFGFGATMALPRISTGRNEISWLPIRRASKD